jgi:hypothetical protein
MTQEQMNDKQAIDMEIVQWLPHDRAYVTTLVAYALGEGIINEDEAKIAKQNIDTFYKDDIKVEQEKNRHMFNIFKKIGFSKTKVLWRLIDQFPKRSYGDPANAEFIPNNEAIIKQTGIPSVSYYEIVNELFKCMYMSKRVKNKKLIYKIHFDMIKADSLEVERQEKETETE